MIIPISLGGSLIAPDGLDTAFLRQITKQLPPMLTRLGKQAVVVTGGGKLARSYLQACRQLMPDATSDQLDHIGIAATRLNAQLVATLFGNWCSDMPIFDPEQATKPQGVIAVAGGWKPGFSTDYVTVALAERFNSAMVINLSDAQQLYDSDPAKNPHAKPIATISWHELQELMGDTWSPGLNLPFDPIATALAARLKLQLIIAGRDIDNLERILSGKEFIGTVIK